MPRLDDVILNILDSIAEEEHSLAKLVAAESQKIKAFLAAHPTNSELIALNQSVSALVNTILMKEIVLLQKLTATIPFIEEEEESSSESSSSSSSSKPKPPKPGPPKPKPPHDESSSSSHPKPKPPKPKPPKP